MQKFLNNLEFLHVNHTIFLRSVVDGFHRDDFKIYTAARTVEIIYEFG